MPRHVWLGLTFMALLITGGRCLKNVRLEVTPEWVEHGHEATLQCHYELSETPLYSLQWYRGSHEFYRYSPRENPAIKIFNLTWIDVDPNNSNETQVTIRNVDFRLSGNFSCEVTADAPSFSSASSSKALTVVSVPKGKPVIASERGRYESGETLKANCSVPASKPHAQLSFTLNDIQVGDGVTRQSNSSSSLSSSSSSSGGTPSAKQRQKQLHPEHNAVDSSHGRSGAGGGIDHHGAELLEAELRKGDRQWTELSLHLQSFHFVHGQLTLRCHARIPGIYEETSEVQLGSALREPVPERVTSENASDNCHRIAKLMIAALILLHLHLR